MEDVLAVYTRPRDGDCPLVCLDETSKQLIAEMRVPIPMKAGRPARFDYEYERNGTANLFMMFAPLEGWRHVKVRRLPGRFGRSCDATRLTISPSLPAALTVGAANGAAAAVRAATATRTSRKVLIERGMAILPHSRVMTSGEPH